MRAGDTLENASGSFKDRLPYRCEGWRWRLSPSYCFLLSLDVHISMLYNSQGEFFTLIRDHSAACKATEACHKMHPKKLNQTLGLYEDCSTPFHSSLETKTPQTFPNRHLNNSRLRRLHTFNSYDAHQFSLPPSHAIFLANF